MKGKDILAATAIIQQLREGILEDIIGLFIRKIRDLNANIVNMQQVDQTDLKSIAGRSIGG